MISDELQRRPALLWCDAAMAEQLTQVGQRFVLVEPSTDCQFLKTLDAVEYRTVDDGSYPLLVAVGFGMRGVDYRAP
jgi:hypothetical protein